MAENRKKKTTFQAGKRIKYKPIDAKLTQLGDVIDSMSAISDDWASWKDTEKKKPRSKSDIGFFSLAEVVSGKRYSDYEKHKRRLSEQSLRKKRLSRSTRKSDVISSLECQEEKSKSRQWWDV